ncbi:MAG TPA: DNA-binding domain-containing protein [Thermoanaerobaculia bacterium]|nr:DNA-binding domain-containing protein [Thermoanaerobaculia bacterium]
MKRGAPAGSSEKGKPGADGGPGAAAPSLDVVQRWFQEVITHPGGASQGIASAEAQRFIPLGRGELERMVRRSRRLTATERLSIYAHAYYARLLECLGECFPVLARALGEEVFDSLAFEYLQRYPSRSYTLDRLGESFARFLEETRPDRDGDADSAEEPATPAWPDFLIDLALLEWTIARVFDGPGVERQPLLGPDDVRTLGAQGFAAARLAPVVCLRLLAFRYPVNSYYTAARRAGPGDEPPLPGPGAEYVALCRSDFVVRRYPLERAQYVLLKTIESGASVGDALAAAAQESELGDEELAAALGDWFRTWAAAGFFQSVA